MPAPQAICSAVFFLYLFYKNFSGQTSHPIISGSTGPIFTMFSLYGRYLVIDYTSDFFFSDRSRDGAMAINFRDKIGKISLSLHTSLSHSETDWNIAMPMGVLTAAMIWLHHVEIW